jgi:hypothetical protein
MTGYDIGLTKQEYSQSTVFEDMQTFQRTLDAGRVALHEGDLTVANHYLSRAQANAGIFRRIAGTNTALRGLEDAVKRAERTEKQYAFPYSG